LVTLNLAQILVSGEQTKGLNPFIILLIAPESRSRRLDRNPTVNRQNPLWVLYGHPDARPLFQ
jgi:hypothetical protein